MKRIIPNNYVEVSDIKVIHKLLYKILYEFHNICEENNLKYTLDFGSLLGAIRHGEIIPWDDDLDVSMPRPDYDKFIKIFNEKYKSGNLILHMPLSENYIYPYAKLGLKDTILYERLEEKYARLSLNMDIFPADGVPEASQKLKSSKYIEKQRKRIIKRTALIGISKVWWKKPFVLVHLLRKFYSSLFPLSYLLNNEICEVAKVDYNTAEIVGYRFSTVKWTIRHEMPKEFFEKIHKVKFGNQYVCITDLYHERLTKEYGDYMKLPPEEERYPIHNYTLYVDKKHIL